MTASFTKLFSTITDSTIWCEPDRTRICWITMLAMADRKGRVWASVPGLAHRAAVPLTDCQAALDTFLAPDRFSRTVAHEGRRIVPIDGGWQLLNYEKYREMRDEETTREAKKRYMREKRSLAKAHVHINAAQVSIVDKTVHSGTPWNQAEAEAEAVPHGTNSRQKHSD